MYDFSTSDLAIVTLELQWLRLMHRQLLTHTSGMIYDYGHDGLKEWSAYHGITENTFSGSLVR